MMLDTQTFLQFAAATLVVAMTPGPDMTLFVGKAIAEGRRAGFATAAGTMTGCIVHTVLVSLGLSALLLAAPHAFLALKVGGAAYLAWLAWKALTRGSAFTIDAAHTRPGSVVQNWATGLAVNLINPKIVLFFVTFLPQFVSISDADAPQKLLVLGLTFVAISIPLTIALVLAAAQIAGLVKRSPRVTRAIDVLFAGIFSYFAIRIVLASPR